MAIFIRADQIQRMYVGCRSQKDMRRAENRVKKAYGKEAVLLAVVACLVTSPVFWIADFSVDIARVCVVIGSLLAMRVVYCLSKTGFFDFIQKQKD